MQVETRLREASAEASITVEHLLSDISELAPDIVARAAELEAGRHIPLDMVEALKSIGAFRMLLPRSHGGLELDLPSTLKVIRALARVEGSVGWTVAIACGGQILAPLLPRTTYDQIYRNGPDTVLAGSIVPAGKGEATEGGWRVNGRWPFASGCRHADWMMGFCVATKDGDPIPGPDGEAGPPVARAVFMPAKDWTIEDTWCAAGLKGTGSDHIALTDALAPEANIADIMNGAPCVPGPLYQAVRPTLPLLHGAVSVGIAEGALDDLVVLANTGRRQLRAATTMRASEIFQFELGRAAADLKAAQAVLEAQAAIHWRRALAGTLRDEALLTQNGQTAAWLVSTCSRIADACFTLGGGAAVYETSPLQRRMRDLHAAAQHAAAHQRQHVDAGKLLLEVQ